MAHIRFHSDFIQSGITPEREITRTRKTYRSNCFSMANHTYKFKTLASTALDERTLARTQNTKPIWPVFFQVRAKKLDFFKIVSDLLCTICSPSFKALAQKVFIIQSTLVISNSKGLSEILRDIRSSTYQVCRIVEKII